MAYFGIGQKMGLDEKSVLAKNRGYFDCNGVGTSIKKGGQKGLLLAIQMLRKWGRVW